MPRVLAATLVLSLVLILGGCEHSLEAPATEIEANSEHMATAAHAYYTDMSRSAVAARRQASDLSDTISFVRMSLALDQFRADPPADDAFQSLDREARALIAAHRGPPVGPPLAATVSNSMLMLLVHPDARRALPEAKRHAAITHYVRVSIENYGMFFDEQIQALEALGPDHASAVKALSQQALTNLEGFKAGLRQPIEMPTWMLEEMRKRMTSTEIRAERQDWNESHQRRLERLKEDRVQERLAVLAGHL
jgi:hypothetical protein